MANSGSGELISQRRILAILDLSLALSTIDQGILLDQEASVWRL